MIEKILIEHSYAMNRTQNSSRAEVRSDIDDAPFFRKLRLPRIRKRVPGEALVVFGKPPKLVPEKVEPPITPPHSLEISEEDIAEKKTIVSLPLRVRDEILMKGRRGRIERMGALKFYVRFDGEKPASGYYIRLYAKEQAHPGE